MTAEFTRAHHFDANARPGHTRSGLDDAVYQARPGRHHDLA
jgi:hypothetical protein